MISNVQVQDNIVLTSELVFESFICNKLIKKIQQIGVDRILTRFILMFCINVLPLFYHAIYTYRKFGVVFKV